MLWAYETVCEPTGVASKYWDADTPSERFTKRLAKEKLVALKESNDEMPGLYYPSFPNTNDSC